MQKLTRRPLQKSDLPKLAELHSANSHFPLPDLENKLYCYAQAVLDERGAIVGIGLVRLTSESILIMGRTQPKTTQVRALRLLMDSMQKEVKQLGMDETHAFIGEYDSKLRSLLKRIYGFVDCKARSIYLQF